VYAWTPEEAARLIEAVEKLGHPDLPYGKFFLDTHQ
jgi:hypothetical protein